jgi:hypothetical protein
MKTKSKYIRKGYVSRKGVPLKHGMSYTRIYRIWANMKDRISNKSNKRYNEYGGRGITLYEPWKKFVEFKNWAYSFGYADNLTIDRIDNDRGYCPDNCRWVTQQINSKNHRVRPMTGIRRRGSGWQVRGKNTYECLGTFKDLETAIQVRDNYAKKQIEIINQLCSNEKD